MRESSQIVFVRTVFFTKIEMLVYKEKSYSINDKEDQRHKEIKGHKEKTPTGPYGVRQGKPVIKKMCYDFFLLTNPSNITSVSPLCFTTLILVG
jgi:hypothetical protein